MSALRSVLSFSVKQANHEQKGHCRYPAIEDGNVEEYFAVKLDENGLVQQDTDAFTRISAQS